MFPKDIKSLSIAWIVIITVFFSIFLTYYRSFISKDYEIVPYEQETAVGDTEAFDGDVAGAVDYNISEMIEEDIYAETLY